MFIDLTVKISYLRHEFYFGLTRFTPQQRKLFNMTLVESPWRLVQLGLVVVVGCFFFFYVLIYRNSEYPVKWEKHCICRKGMIKNFNLYLLNKDISEDIYKKLLNNFILGFKYIQVIGTQRLWLLRVCFCTFLFC